MVANQEVQPRTGVYLTYVGSATRPAPASQAPSATRDLPRAA